MPRQTTAAQIAKLKAQIKKLEEKEKAIDARKQKKALAQIAALAKSSQLTIAQIQAAVGRRAGAKRIPAAEPGSKLAGRKLAPKYRNPANDKQTWAGRGRAPKWAEDLRVAGKLETALIP